MERSRAKRVARGLTRRFTAPRLVERYPVLEALDDDLEKCSWIREHVYLTDRFVIKTSRHDTAFLIRNEAASLKRVAGTPYFPRVEMLHEEPDTTLLVLSRLPGSDLSCQFGLNGARREVFVRDSAEICAALAAADLEHRDITPRNLLISDERLSLLDFEFARCDENPITPITAAERSHLEYCLERLGGVWRSESNEAGFAKILANFDNRTNPLDRLGHSYERAKRLLRT